MSLYEILMIIHLLAAMVWIGGGVAVHVMVSRAAASERAQLIPHVSWYGSRVISGSSVVLILAAFGLVAEGDWKFFEFWILFAVAVWLVSGFIGGGLIGKLGHRVEEIAASPSPDLAEIGRLTERILFLARIDLVLLVLVVIDMVTKPGL